MAHKRRGARRLEPRHSVDISLAAFDIPKAGAAVRFRVHAYDGPEKTLLGTIEIGQGTFGWKPARKQSFRRVAWAKFARVADENL